MRRETNNDRQQRLFVTGLLISAVVGALIGLWPVWFPADSACETTIPDASFSVPTLAMGGTQLPGEEGAAMKICCLTFDDGPSKYTPQVLAALEKCDAKATFFVTAQDANQDYLSYLTDIEAAGHQIALHSASHSYSTGCGSPAAAPTRSATDTADGRSCSSSKPRLSRKAMHGSTGTCAPRTPPPATPTPPRSCAMSRTMPKTSRFVLF